MNQGQSLKSEADKNIPRGYDPKLYKIRHSLAHVLAQAVLERFPGAQYAAGPPIDTGFYYDFTLPSQPSDEDLAWVEKRMGEIVRGQHAFSSRVVSPEEARKIFHDQPYKLELIDGLTGGQLDEDGEKLVEGAAPVLTVYQHDRFIDLCRGPHIENTSEIPPEGFKVLNIAGAYWRGDEKRPMLTRIYATAWYTKKDLDDFLVRLEEAKRRDHRRLGPELEIFTTNPLIGAGLPLWLPKGATVRRQLEQYITTVERQEGYLHVYTPALGKKELYELSGHWAHYKDDMFPIMEIGDEKIVLRPMCCPHHIMVFKSKMHSYRDLPVRIGELGTMYRFERSGVVAGLSRVRCMTLNDAHIFCRPEQVKEEFGRVVKLIEQAYATLGIKEYSYRLSLRDPEDKKKYVDNDAMWELGERVLREAMKELNLPHEEAPGEAAFYGPKLDIQLRDLLGREQTVSTIQVDFHLPEQLDISYIGEDSKRHRPVIIHRAIISTMERMVSYLIELYAGAFPPWLAPLQAVFVPITTHQVPYAHELAAKLRRCDFRVEVDDTDKRMNAKVREHQLKKIPFILVVGAREAEAGTVAVRTRTGEQLPPMPYEEFEQLLRRLVETRALTLS